MREALPMMRFAGANIYIWRAGEAPQVSMISFLSLAPLAITPCAAAMAWPCLASGRPEETKETNQLFLPTYVRVSGRHWAASVDGDRHRPLPLTIIMGWIPAVLAGNQGSMAHDTL